VAHEWGTFTSVLDSQGRTLTWNPFGFFEPLPPFVHTSVEVKPDLTGSVRMETPVVYFYGQRPLTLDVRVGFPSGKLTEWYPQAEAGEGSATLAWNGVELVPGADFRYPTRLKGEHYFAARGVASTPLRMGNGEVEKFLFYRGVGSFAQPLSVRLVGEGTEQEFELVNRGAEPIHRVFLFAREGVAVALHKSGPLAPGASLRVARRALVQAGDVALEPLEEELCAHGLFADEAQAMIATWRRDWFAPGLRAFYVLPRGATDALLPLALTPPPKRLERVLVGRLELFEPELEAAVLAAARAVAAEQSTPDQAFTALGPRLTRFGLALVQARLEGEQALQVAQWKLEMWLRERAL
jgi:hypothetical protein